MGSRIRLTSAMVLFVVISMIQPSHQTNPKYDRDWEEFVGKYKRNYTDANETSARRDAFEKNLEFIRQHNEHTSQNGSSQDEQSYQLGLNEFSDLSDEEFSRTKYGLLNGGVDNRSKRASDDGSQRQSKTRRRRRQSLPLSLNYTQLGYVTPVQNQGSCSSCWAFAAAASLEGQLFKKSKSLKLLSKQNIIDCSSNSLYGNSGCNGGYSNQALLYVKNQGGIDTESSYPYQAQLYNCRYQSSTSAGNFTAGVNYINASGDETLLQSTLYNVGPVVAYIDASQKSFRLYKSGVYYSSSCSSTNPDHAVTVVGYGTTSSNVQYWLVKNSWGTTWGMYGYVMMARNRNNNCGIASTIIYPTVA